MTSDIGGNFIREQLQNNLFQLFYDPEMNSLFACGLTGYIRGPFLN